MVLWVDQVCIDQNNHAEKADQVLLMAEVYTKAEQVLVWLGPEADRSDELMDLWQEIGQRAFDLGVQDYFTRGRSGSVESGRFRSSACVKTQFSSAATRQFE
ncbi:hypothetical protein ACHAPT_003039 [Fusarium lateritium]